MQPRSVRHLTELGTTFETIEVPGGVHTVEDVQNACHCTREEIIKALLFVGETPVLVLVPGDKKVDLDALRIARADTSLRMATRNEVHSITGYTVGSVSPFGLPPNLDVIIDETIRASASLIVGSGRSDLLIKLPQAEFAAALHGTFYPLAQSDRGHNQ